MQYNQVQEQKVVFCNETCHVMDGRKLFSMRPNKAGFFTHPVAVIGGNTRTDVLYEPMSYKEQITGDTKFSALLREGGLQGEFGHPFGSEENPKRAVHIEPKCVSHIFRKFWVDEEHKLSTGGNLLMAQVKPYGPFGDKLLAGFLDENVNTAFSLRAISSQALINATIRRWIKHLVTFDSVIGGGYKEASKRFADGLRVSQEGFSYDLHKEDFLNLDGTVAIESFSEQEILGIFGGNEIVINRDTTVLRFSNEASVYDKKTGMRSSLTHKLLKF